MEILDEKGRLFGRVNVVDALVVVFAVAVVVAGAALVFGGSPNAGETDSDETMHVTLLTHGDVAETVEPGAITLDGASANVTDVHRTPGPRAVLRVALDGTATEEGFRFGGNPVRLGDGYTLATNTTVNRSRVVARDVSPTLDTGTTPVTVAATVRRPVAEAISTGDDQTVGDSTVATVTAVDASAVNESHSDVRVTLDLSTRTVDGVPYYATDPVRLGRTLDVATTDYEFDGEIIARE